MRLGFAIVSITPEMLAADPELAAAVASAPKDNYFGTYPFLSPARNAQARELERRGCLIAPKPMGWSVAPAPRDPNCPVSSFTEWMTPAENTRYRYWLEYLAAQRSSAPPGIIKAAIALMTWGIGTAFEAAAEAGIAVAEAGSAAGASAAEFAATEFAAAEFAAEGAAAEFAAAEAASEFAFEEFATQSLFEEAAGEFAAESFYSEAVSDFGIESTFEDSVFNESLFDSPDFFDYGDASFFEDAAPDVIAQETGQKNFLQEQLEKQTNKEIRKRVMNELFKPTRPSAPQRRTVAREPQVIYRTRAQQPTRQQSARFSESMSPYQVSRSVPQTVSPASVYANSMMNTLYRPDTVSTQPASSPAAPAPSIRWPVLVAIPIAAILLFGRG